MLKVFVQFAIGLSYLIIQLRFVECQASVNCVIQEERCTCGTVILEYPANVFKRYQRVACSLSMNYTEFPANELRELTVNKSLNFSEVKVNDKPIKVIRSFTFVNITIIRLDISMNEIEEIQANAFVGLKDLDSLILNQNFIKTLYPGSFFDLDLLSVVDLKSQQLTHLKPGVFDGLKSVSTLRLNLNRISQLEADTFFGITNVVNLYLDSNNLQLIRSHAFRGMSEIVRLNFKQYGLSQLETCAFCGLINLTKLELGNNFLIDLVNDTFLGLDKLSYLDLSNNKLESIETNTFRSLTSLTTLDLSNNYLSRLGAYMFKDLNKVKSIDLSHNNLIDIQPQTFYNTGYTCNYLILNDNRFEKIYSHFFTGLSRLLTLNLSRNLISSIDDRSFDHLESLTTLSLADNCIFQLDSNLFKKLVNLKILDLDDNTASKITADSFTNLKQLSKLSLSPNDLKSFILDSQLLPNIYYLDLKSSYQLSYFYLVKQIKYLRLDNSKTFLIVWSSDGSPFINLTGLYLKNFVKLDQVNFRLLTNLTELDLSFNDISSLSYFFNIKTKYSSLKSLFLQGSTFNFSINLLLNFPNLVELDLGSSRWDLSVKPAGKLKYLDKLKLNNLDIDLDFVEKYFSLFNFNALSYIDLSYNKLEFFPHKENVQKWIMKNLKYLNLRSNRIKMFNFDLIVSDWSFKIDSLDLGYNDLGSILVINALGGYGLLNHSDIFLDHNNSTFDGSFKGFFASLFSANSHIDMSFNKLTSKSLRLVNNLKNRFLYLNLSNNNIEEFTLDIFQVKTKYELPDPLVKYLDLSVNYLSSLEDLSFETCYLLNYLNISFNRLTFLPPQLFSNLRYLLILDLSNNFISELSPNLFKSLLFLEYLNMSSNQINSSTLIPKLFEFQYNLFDLDLSKNNIKFIDPYLFRNATSLKNLYIQSNPILNLDRLYGISSINSIYSSSFLFRSFETVLNLKMSITQQPLTTRMFKKYYKATYVVYESESNRVYDDFDCANTLFLVRYLILLNLKNDWGLKKFLTECDIYSNRLFSGHV